MGQGTEKSASKALDYAGLKINKAAQTDALLFLSATQAKELARLIIEGVEDKQRYKDALKEYPSVDMALFGRMVASDASLNYDAAAQVAHSISTHEVHNEYDYFTAVDDCAPQDNMGAGHLGTVEFHSATLYRYATVNIKELAQHLHAETPEQWWDSSGHFCCRCPQVSKIHSQTVQYPIWPILPCEEISLSIWLARLSDQFRRMETAM